MRRPSLRLVIGVLGCLAPVIGFVPFGLGATRAHDIVAALKAGVLLTLWCAFGLVLGGLSLLLNHPPRSRIVLVLGWLGITANAVILYLLAPFVRIFF